MSGWLAKLGIGLKRSSQKISGGISDIFDKRKIEAATLEELEELLITADMGVKASAKSVEAFGGEMELSWEGAFALILKLPGKERDDEDPYCAGRG